MPCLNSVVLTGEKILRDTHRRDQMKWKSNSSKLAAYPARGCLIYASVISVKKKKDGFGFMLPSRLEEVSVRFLALQAEKR